MTTFRARLAGLACGVLASLTVSAASAQPLEKMIFARAAPWGIVDAPISFALDLGFFKQEGIDAQFVVVGGSYAAVQQILSGAAQTGFVANEALPLAMQPGKTPIPLRVAYSYHRNTPIFELMVPEASPIKKLEDFKGKKIGVLTLATGNVPVTRAALTLTGLKPTDYTLLPVGLGAQATQALVSGQIDALNLWHTVHAQIEDSGVALRRIPYPKEFENFPSTGLGFTDAFIRDKPELVARYGRAMTKGTVACVANPQGCIRAFWRQNPALKPAGDEAKAMASALKVLNVAFTRLVPPGGQPYGAYTETEWGNLLKAFQVGGAMTKTDLPLDRMYTNQFVEEYNKFDRAAVEAAAKAAR